MSWFREWLVGEAPRADRADDRRTSPAPSGRPSRSAAAASAAATPDAATPPDAATSHPGERFGLPADGRGSVATLARRGAQFLLDAVLAGLLAAVFTYPALPQNWSLVTWAVLMIVPVSVVAATPDIDLLGLRVVRLDRPEAAGVGLLWTVVRTASLFFIVPALIVDHDVRGVHDRASRTVVVRTR